MNKTPSYFASNLSDSSPNIEIFKKIYGNIWNENATEISNSTEDEEYPELPPGFEIKIQLNVEQSKETQVRNFKYYLYDCDTF